MIKYENKITELNEINAATNGVLRALDNDIVHAVSRRHFGATIFMDYKKELLLLQTELAEKKRQLIAHYEVFISNTERNKTRDVIKNDKAGLAVKFAKHPVAVANALSFFYHSEKDAQTKFAKKYDECKAVTDKIEKIIEDYRGICQTKRVRNKR